MTQADLGAKIGVSGATISNWETGKIVPDREQKAQLKEVLGGFNPEATEAPDQAPVGSAPSAFGAWLNKARLEKRLSVAELSGSSGVSAPAIYNIESGRIGNPRAETIRRLEKALGSELSNEAKQEIRQEATIKGVGELVGFDPHNEDDLPAGAGIYVFYDISDRPIYVGQSGNLRTRIKAHKKDAFWFRSPVVETGAYVQVDDEDLRVKVETLLIRFLKSNAVLNKQNVDR
jgi:transcriptional regulator with XRE-family HTH domain